MKCCAGPSWSLQGLCHPGRVQAWALTACWGLGMTCVNAQVLATLVYHQFLGAVCYSLLPSCCLKMQCSVFLRCCYVEEATSFIPKAYTGIIAGDVRQSSAALNDAIKIRRSRSI